MRKQFIFIFFLSTFGCFGQEYSFDLFTNYEFTDYKITSTKSKEIIKSVGNEVIMTKSNDDHIHLTVRRGKNQKLYGIIIDSKTNFSHIFSIIEKEKGTLDITEFKYEFSVDWSDSECFNNKNEYEIEAVSDSSEYNLKFTIFPNKTMKDSDGYILLEKQESENSFYNNFKYGFLHHFDSCGKIKLDTNIVINIASFFDYNGNCLKRIKLINKLITEFNFSIKKTTYKNTTDYFDFIDKK